MNKSRPPQQLPSTEDLVPDWLMGGNRKRRVLTALASPPKDGWVMKDLVDELKCGRTTAFEIVRALRALGVLETMDSGGIRLAPGAQLTKAIKVMVKALEPYVTESVDRPPRKRGPT